MYVFRYICVCDIVPPFSTLFPTTALFPALRLHLPALGIALLALLASAPVLLSGGLLTPLDVLPSFVNLR